MTMRLRNLWTKPEPSEQSPAPPTPFKPVRHRRKYALSRSQKVSFAADWNDGITYNDLAAKYRISTHLVNDLRKELGLEPRYKGKNIWSRSPTAVDDRILGVQKAALDFLANSPGLTRNELINKATAFHRATYGPISDVAIRNYLSGYANRATESERPVGVDVLSRIGKPLLPRIENPSVGTISPLTIDEAFAQMDAHLEQALARIDAYWNEREAKFRANLWAVLDGLER